MAEEKRQRSDSSISPPPIKRRRANETLDHPTQQSFSDGPLTIYSWNIYGISPFLQPSTTSFFKGSNPSDQVPKASIRDFLRRHKWPQLLFLQEVKINPDDSSTIQAVKQAVTKPSNGGDDAYDYEAHFCLPGDAHNARGFGRKVYGVCSIIRKDFHRNYVSGRRLVDWDREGRVLVIETAVKDGDMPLPKLAIINVYAVNGTDNLYKDPETGEVVGTRHDRKLEFHKRLQAEVRTLENDGFGVIVAGDINIARAPIDGYPNLRTFPEQHRINRADFEKRFFASRANPKESHDDAGSSLSKEASEDTEEGLGMIDTFRELHSAQTGYTYYPRTKTFGDSCDRVDMILASRSLKSHLVEAGIYETPSERGPSDHVPLFARFDFASACCRSRASSGSSE